MARVQYADVVVNEANIFQKNNLISITPVAGTSATNKLWKEETGKEELASVITNSSGSFSVWLDEGIYDVKPEGTKSRRINLINQSNILRGELHPEDSNKNIAIGSKYSSLSTGDKNFSLGTGALKSITSGNRNVAIGDEALGSNTSANVNMAIGTNALKSNTIGEFNIAIGTNTLESLVNGRVCEVIGVESAPIMTEGEYVQAFGANTLLKLKKSTNELFIGVSAGEIYEGNGAEYGENTVIGIYAASLMKKGRGNTIMGKGSGVNNQSNENAFYGWASGESNKNGAGNTGIGTYSLKLNEEGNGNTAIGVEAGRRVKGSGNVFIGKGTGSEEASFSNQLWIANSNTTTPLILGVFPNSELTFNTEKLALYKGVTPVARHAAISEPAETTASLKASVNTIREVLKNVGLTS